MPTLPINGAQLRVRMSEVELDRLKLDPDNPRLHSAYLTHVLPPRPNESQLLQALESLPEFGALPGCHFPEPRMLPAAVDYE